MHTPYPIKAVFFDVDGTLLSHRTNTISPSALSAIGQLRAQGILVFLATGRHRIILETLPQLQALRYDGAVTLNGSYCYDMSHVLYRNPIRPESIAALLDYLDKHPTPCAFLEENRMYLNFRNDRVRQAHEAVHSPIPPLGDLRRGLEHPVFQALLYVHAGEPVPPIPQVQAARWCSGGLDIIPAGSGKSVGIQKLLAHYGIRKEETMGFGDGDNDLDMFRAVGTTVAMGNAVQPVRENADYVTTDVDDHGVARALTHFGLCKPLISLEEKA